MFVLCCTVKRQKAKCRTIKHTERSKDNTKKKKIKIPVGARIFALVQTGAGAHAAFCTIGGGLFPGG